MFTIRVYGILQNEEGHYLVMDELIKGAHVTKFPGGGLEFGEGTRQCLVRECMEEMQLKVDVKEHFYTTDFFQQSAFDAGKQVISIYYRLQPLSCLPPAHTGAPFYFSPGQLEVYERTGEAFNIRYIPAQQMNEDAVTLPIDKIVAGMLAAKSTW